MSHEMHEMLTPNERAMREVAAVDLINSLSDAVNKWRDEEVCEHQLLGMVVAYMLENGALDRRSSAIVVPGDEPWESDETRAALFTGLIHK